MDTEHEEIHKKLDKIIAMLEEHIKDRPFKSWNVMGEHKEIPDNEIVAEWWVNFFRSKTQ